MFLFNNNNGFPSDPAPTARPADDGKALQVGKHTLTRRGLLTAAATGTATVIVGPAMSKAAQAADGVVVGVHHTGIFVDSVEASIHFYVDLLGLQLRSSPGPAPTTSPTFLDPIFDVTNGLYRVGSVQSPGDPTFGTNAHFIELFEVLQPRISPEKKATIRREGNYVVSFLVNDARKLHRTLKAAGIKAVSDGPVEIEPGRWAVHVPDPDNSLVELVEPGGLLIDSLS